jgi:putative hydrolase of the HAD superfamily
MRPLTVRCIVFDLDDTLYLEREYVRSGFDAVGAEAESRWGIADFAGRAWRLFEEGTRGNIFDLVLVECGVTCPPEAMASLVACYREHRPAIRLLDDARSCLDRLLGRVALAGLTDGPAASQRAKVTALGLERWLSPMIVTSELGPGLGKPSPHGFRRIEEATGEHGAACLYVADNPSKDFAGPRQLGWRTVRIRRPGGLYADRVSGEDIDWEIESLDELAGGLGMAPAPAS